MIAYKTMNETNYPNLQMKEQNVPALGKMVSGVGLYGKATDTTCLPFEDNNLEDLLNLAIQNIDVDYDITENSIDEPEQEDASIPAIPNIKNYSYTIVNDVIYYRENSRMNRIDVNGTADQRIRGLITIRDSVHKVIDYQLEGQSLEKIQSAQSKLNNRYNQFASQYNRINTRANNLAFRDDSSYYLLCSLEILEDKQKFKMHIPIN